MRPKGIKVTKGGIMNELTLLEIVVIVILVAAEFGACKLPKLFAAVGKKRNKA